MLDVDVRIEEQNFPPWLDVRINYGYFVQQWIAPILFPGMTPVELLVHSEKEVRSVDRNLRRTLADLPERDDDGELLPVEQRGPILVGVPTPRLQDRKGSHPVRISRGVVPPENVKVWTLTVAPDYHLLRLTRWDHTDPFGTVRIGRIQYGYWKRAAWLLNREQEYVAYGVTFEDGWIADGRAPKAGIRASRKHTCSPEEEANRALQALDRYYPQRSSYAYTVVEEVRDGQPCCVLRIDLDD